MIVPFRIPKGTSLAVAKKILTRTVNDLFADCPPFDLTLAVGAGHRALERSEPFMDAVAVAEGVLNLWQDMVDRSRGEVIERRNRERLIAYRSKSSALLEL